MRVNREAQAYYANMVQSAQPQAAHGNRSHRPDKVDDVGAKTARRDRVELSTEATERYGQSKLQEEILGKLKERLAAEGVDFDAALELDWSPDATAQRIFDFASGLMGVFRDQNPELSESELIDKFESTVRGAVDEGYGQAIEILQGLSVDQGVLDTAQTTIDKVHSLFDDFFANLRAGLEGQDAETTAAQG